MVIVLKLETLFLRLVVVFLAVPVLALCIFVVPGMGRYAAETVLPLFPPVKFFVWLVLYVSAAAYYVALYQAFNLLRFIDRNVAFSELSVEALKKIKYCAVAIGILHSLVLPLYYFVAKEDDAPGVVLVGCFVPFASLVIAVFAAVLQKLLQHVIAIKTENDLTI